MSVDFDTRAFDRGLASAIADIEDRGARALRANAETIIASAKAKVPVDTGELRDSIGIKDEGRDANGPYIDVGSDSDHAIYQEFGTVYDSPQPFMRPALAEAPEKFGK